MPLPGGVVGSVTSGNEAPVVTSPTNPTLRINVQPLAAMLIDPVKEQRLFGLVP